MKKAILFLLRVMTNLQPQYRPEIAELIAEVEAEDKPAEAAKPAKPVKK